jgi:aminotransferase EvaB
MMKVPYNYLPEQFPKPGTTRERNITSRILDRIKDVAIRGDFTLGNEVEEFENDWSQAVGSEYSIGMSNGTDAIAIALDAAGLQVGEEVITSPLSFIATSGAIIQAGGKPVFVDVISPTSPNISLNGVSNHQLEHTRWFVPVLWAGSTAGFDSWENLPSGSHVIYDAAQAVNARVADRQLGFFPWIDALTYSLHPLKNINVWGDGGMIATNSRSIDYNARLLRNHGLVGRDQWVRPGFNSRLSTVQAAVGLEVLPSLEPMATSRQLNAVHLIENLSEVEGVIPPDTSHNERNGWHLFQVIVEGNRKECVEFLNERGVEAKIHYDTPLHLQEAMRPLGHAPGDFPNAELFCRQNVTLPIHEYLTPDQVDYIVDVFIEWSKGGA